MEYLEIIKKTFIGQYLTECEIAHSFQNSDFIIKKFCKGDLLHLAGDDCTKLEILLEGSVIITQIDQSGIEIIICILKKGDVIAANILYGNNAKYSFTYTAQSDGCLLKINKSYFFKLISENPLLLKQLLKIISDCTILLVNKITLSKRKTLRSLIMKFLYNEIMSQNSNTIILPISKTDLGKHFDVQRTSISREFRRMERDGLIKLSPDKKKVEVLVCMSTD